MKIFHVISGLNRGGAETLLYDLIKNSSDNFQHTVFYYETDEKQELVTQFEQLGVKIINSNIFRNWKNFGDFPDFRKIIKNIKPDVVHLHNSLGWKFSFAIASKLCGIKKIISSIHGTPKELSKFDFFVYKNLEKISSCLVTNFVAISNEVTNFEHKTFGVPLKKIVLIHNGIDASRLKITQNKENLRAELGILQNDFVLGTIGNLRFIKGADLLIKAVSYFEKDFPNLKIVFVGKASELQHFKELQKLAEKLKLTKKIIFAGLRNDVADLLNIFDVYVQPSRREGFGIALAEAMFLEKPCVAFKIGGIPEILTNEKIGFLAEAENTKSLSEQIKRMILLKDEERLELGKSAKTFVTENFLVEKMVAKYEKLYCLQKF
ncbi:glycosyltransferase [bacterium]|nr:glycosyltransferase [bacterium]